MTSRLLLSFLTSALLTPVVGLGQVLRLEEGQALFTTTCYRCHALSAGDTGRLAPAIQTMGMARFTAGIWNQSHSMFRAFEVEGWKPPRLTKEEMSAIFLFTQVIAETAEKGDAALGKKFVESNRCLVCHSVGGRGAGGAIPLDRFAFAEHPSVIMSAIWSHRLGMVNAFRDVGLPPPRFHPGDLANLAAYLKESATPSVSVPVLTDFKALTVDPELFSRFRCNRCHTPMEFAGQPERSHEEITEALLSHAFMPAFESPPFNKLEMSSEDSMSLATLVSYYGHLDRRGSQERGRDLFRQRNCADCHDLPEQPDPDSGKVLVGEITNEWDFTTRIFNKVPLMIEKARLESKAFPRLSPEEIRHLFAYLCAVSGECEPIVGQ